MFGVSFHLTQIVFANDGKSILHAWNDGFYAVVSARRESVSGASKRHVFTAVGRSGLGLHFPFSGISLNPPLWSIVRRFFCSLFRLFVREADAF